MRAVHVQVGLIAAGLLLVTTHLFAVRPSYVMFYGSPLDAAIYSRITEGIASEFLWTPYRHGGTIPKGLEGRPYVNYAVFWGRWEKNNLTPGAASQHGRLYLPMRSKPAMIVITEAVMDDGTPERPSARPIPVELKGFWKAWPVRAKDLAFTKRLGVP